MENEGVLWIRYKGDKKGPEQDQRVSTNRHLFFFNVIEGYKRQFWFFYSSSCESLLEFRQQLAKFREPPTIMPDVKQDDSPVKKDDKPLP